MKMGASWIFPALQKTLCGPDRMTDFMGDQHYFQLFGDFFPKWKRKLSGKNIKRCCIGSFPNNANVF
jgi:hypothetical protein